MFWLALRDKLKPYPLAIGISNIISCYEVLPRVQAPIFSDFLSIQRCLGFMTKQFSYFDFQLRLKRKELDSICRAKPTVLDRNREKVFTKLATKGVVQVIIEKIFRCSLVYADLLQLHRCKCTYLAVNWSMKLTKKTLILKWVWL